MTDGCPDCDIGCISDTLQTWANGSPRGLGPYYRVDGENFPATLLNPLNTHMSSVGPCVVSVGRSSSSPDIFHAVDDKASGVSEGNEQHWLFLLAAKTRPSCIFQHSKIVTVAIRTEELKSTPSLAVLCDTIPCCVILVLDQSDETILHSLSWFCEGNHCFQQVIIPAIVRKHFLL